MVKIALKGLDKDCFAEKLENGLDVVFIPYEDKKNYYISYVVRFGSEDTSFVFGDDKKYITVPNGVAHFLEHKMFEQEDGVDPFKFFSESGTGANAFTSFNSTQYICYGTKDLEKNLAFLIDYVNSPYFTDQNVEKEKGIIKEEVKMYEDIPEWLLESKLRNAIYNTNPRKYDIAGTVEDVESITKEDLYTCYNTFYNPNNMFLVVAGNFDKDSVLKLIKEKLENKENRIEKIKRKHIREARNVSKEETEMSIDIRVPKIALGYKMKKHDFKYKDDIELDLYLQMISSILFGSSSLFRDRVRQNKLMLSFYNEWDTTKDYKTLIIYAETENPDLLIGEVEKELKNIDIKEEDIERIKKVWIANEVRMIDSIDATVSNIIDDKLLYDRLINNKKDLIRKMNKKKVDEILSKMDFTNRSKVILLPNKIIVK